jgi:hypothetical protein
MEFLRRFEDRAPEYSMQYRDLIDAFAVIGGDHDDTEKKQQSGRFFSNIYEFYVYATCLGLSRDYKIPIPEGSKKMRFLPIKDWKPSDLMRFVTMSLIAKSDIDLVAVEDYEEQAVEDKLTELKQLLEAYANGGFDIIEAKRQEDATFFQDEYCFMKLLR